MLYIYIAYIQMYLDRYIDRQIYLDRYIYIYIQIYGLCPQGDHSPLKNTDDKILIIRKCDEYVNWKYVLYVLEHRKLTFLIPPKDEGIFQEALSITAIITITKAKITFSFNSNQED